MTTPATVNLTIVQGDDFSPIFRWYNADSKLYRKVTAVPSVSPLRLTIASHGIPDGWMVTPSGFLGMKELNYVGEVPAKVVDANTIELNSVNAASFKIYTSGGVLTLFEPVDLTGYSARMQVRATVASATTLLDLTSAAGGIAIDNAAKTIRPVVTAAATAALSWTSGVYDLELVSAGGTVTKIARGRITVAVKEVTR